MTAIMLLAIGNGVPGVFASITTVCRGNYRTWFGAILSARTSVAVYGAGFTQLGEERHVLFDFSFCSIGQGNFSSHCLPCITSRRKTKGFYRSNLRPPQIDF